MSCSTQSEQNCVVVGSCFLDYVGYCDRVPSAGETVHSSSFQKGFGGKGANQAVMIAKLKQGTKGHEEVFGSGFGSVKMVSAVGADGDGDAYINNLKSFDINTDGMLQFEKQSTGLAMISVSTVTGQNQIVICPNATNSFTPDSVNWDKVFGPKSASSSDSTNNASVLVLQNEIPLETTMKAIEGAHERGYFVVFNPAPVPTAEQIARLTPLMPKIDLFCPNESEAALITGFTVDTANAEQACDKILSLGVKNALVTLGSKGFALKSAAKGFTHFPAVKCPGPVIDTTGAGDCFVGTLVATLLQDPSGVKSAGALERAGYTANISAAISVTRKGTQSSYPSLEELRTFYRTIEGSQAWAPKGF